MAVCSAVSMSSEVLPEIAVKGVVTGLIVASGASPARASRTLLRAVLTDVAVIAASISAVSPANHVLGLCPDRLATIRSVSGVMLAVPQLVAMEW